MDNKIYMQGVELIQITIQKQFTEPQLKVYKMLLDDISDEQFMYGIQELLKQRVYTNIPSVAEIRQFALQTREDDLIVKSSLAAEKLKKAIGSVGTYRTVAFDDPIIHLIVRSLGGWTNLGMMQIEKFDDMIKWDFPKLYKAYSTRKNAEIPLMLEGRGEDKKIFYVGDKEKALRWQGAYKAMLENKNSNIKNLENKIKIGE